MDYHFIRDVLRRRWWAVLSICLISGLLAGQNPGSRTALISAWVAIILSPAVCSLGSASETKRILYSLPVSNSRRAKTCWTTFVAAPILWSTVVTLVSLWIHESADRTGAASGEYRFFPLLVVMIVSICGIFLLMGSGLFSGANRRVGDTFGSIVIVMSALYGLSALAEAGIWDGIPVLRAGLIGGGLLLLVLSYVFARRSMESLLGIPRKPRNPRLRAGKVKNSNFVPGLQDRVFSQPLGWAAVGVFLVVVYLCFMSVLVNLVSDHFPIWDFAKARRLLGFVQWMFTCFGIGSLMGCFTSIRVFAVLPGTRNRLIAFFLLYPVFYVLCGGLIMVIIWSLSGVYPERWVGQLIAWAVVSVGFLITSGGVLLRLGPIAYFAAIYIVGGATIGVGSLDMRLLAPWGIVLTVVGGVYLSNLLRNSSLPYRVKIFGMSAQR